MHEFRIKAKHHLLYFDECKKRNYDVNSLKKDTTTTITLIGTTIFSPLGLWNHSHASSQRINKPLKNKLLLSSTKDIFMAKQIMKIKIDVIS